MKMLNKIENISPNSSFKEKASIVNNLKELNSVTDYSISIADSYSFSSAIKYLGQLKWKLKQFKQSLNGQVEVEFSFDYFTFHTLLFGPDFFSQSAEYKISNDISTEYKNLIYEVHLKFEFYNKVLFDPISVLEINYLRHLYTRIANTENLNYLISANLSSNSSFLEGISSGLIKELSDIHKKLLTFLEKATGNPQIPPFSSLVFQEDENKLQINILRIESKN